MVCLSFSSSKPWPPKAMADAAMRFRTGSASCDLGRAMMARMRTGVRVSGDIYLTR